MKFLRSPCGILAGLALTACSPAVDPPSASQPTADASRPDPAAQAAAASPAAIHAVAPIGAAPVDAAPAGPTAPVASAAVTAPSPLVDAINAAGPPGDTAAAAGDAGRDSLIRLEVLLDRAGFSPGVIDGRPGGNLKAAIAAWQASRGLPADGTATPAVWDGLTRADPRPVATRYVLTADDVKGPFIGSAPSDMEAMAKLERLGFTGPAQELAERFHMDVKLLAALNPGADLKAAGTAIVVVSPGAADGGAAAKVEVDKTAGQVRALDDAGKVVAVFPATVGSAERPAPSGVWAVRDIARNPVYTFDPARLTFGKAKHKLTIAAGPNNPVGSTWIGLTKDTYGIHGAPDPTKVGKVASHGCVRLTNWDARRLSGMVRKGTPVVFVGEAAS